MPCSRIRYSSSHLNPLPYFAFRCIMPDRYPPPKDDTTQSVWLVWYSMCSALLPRGMLIWAAVQVKYSSHLEFLPTVVDIWIYILVEILKNMSECWSTEPLKPRLPNLIFSRSQQVSVTSPDGAKDATRLPVGRFFHNTVINEIRGSKQSSSGPNYFSVSYWEIDINWNG